MYTCLHYIMSVATHNYVGIIRSESMSTIFLVPCSYYHTELPKKIEQMFEDLDIFVQVRMVNRVHNDDDEEATTALLSVNATTSKILNYIFTETKPKCVLTRDATATPLDDDNSLYKFVVSVCECAEYLDTSTTTRLIQTPSKLMEPMLYFVYFANLRTGVCVQNENIPVCVWNYFKDIKLYTNIPKSLEPVISVFLQEWETLSYQQIEKKLDMLASLISEEKASTSHDASSTRPMRGKHAPIPHGHTKYHSFNSNGDAVPTEQALRDSERQKVITYIKSKYIVTDKTDVVNRIKFNELANELEHALYIPKDKSVVFRNKLSCYLTSPTIGLSKKRYTDGIYYYGIKPKEVPTFETVEEADTYRDELLKEPIDPILTNIGIDAYDMTDTSFQEVATTDDTATGGTAATTTSTTHTPLDSLFPSFTQMQAPPFGSWNPYQV
jgi:hypothetical protein